MKKYSILVFFWIFVILFIKDFTLTEEITYCFDKLEGAPHERCPECGLSREIYDNQTFLERHFYEIIPAILFLEIFYFWLTFDPKIPLFEVFDPNAPWTHDLLILYVKKGYFYEDFFKWTEYFYPPKDPGK